MERISIFIIRNGSLGEPYNIFKRFDEKIIQTISWTNLLYYQLNRNIVFFRLILGSRIQKQ